jgi:hypothetical protein
VHQHGMAVAGKTCEKRFLADTTAACSLSIKKLAIFAVILCLAALLCVSQFTFLHYHVFKGQ